MHALAVLCWLCCSCLGAWPSCRLGTQAPGSIARSGPPQRGPWARPPTSASARGLSLPRRQTLAAGTRSGPAAAVWARPRPLDRWRRVGVWRGCQGPQHAGAGGPSQTAAVLGCRPASPGVRARLASSWRRSLVLALRAGLGVGARLSVPARSAPSVGCVRRPADFVGVQHPPPGARAPTQSARERAKPEGDCDVGATP